MRILHCMETIGSGGVEQRRLLLARAAVGNGCQHRIICTKAIGPLAEELRDLGVELIEVGPVRSIFHPRRYRMALKVIREWRPDIVHGAVIEGYTLAGIAGRLGRVPAVIMEETSDPANRSWKGHLLCRQLSRLAHVCVAVSPAVGEYLERIGVPKAKVRVLANGVERPTEPTDEAVAAERRKLGIEPGDVVVGSVGRVNDDHKRFSDLIAAVAQMGREVPVKLLIVGDGPDRETLQRQAVEAGLAERVVFTGYRRDTGLMYALMDVFALASAREAFGLVVAEAMRCGLPVVATNVGGIPHIVVEAEAGRLVAAKNPEALKAALLPLIGDEALRHRLGENGQRRAEAQFSAARYVNDVQELYESLVETRGVVLNGA